MPGRELEQRKKLRLRSELSSVNLPVARKMTREKSLEKLNMNARIMMRAKMLRQKSPTSQGTRKYLRSHTTPAMTRREQKVANTSTETRVDHTRRLAYSSPGMSASVMSRAVSEFIV